MASASITLDEAAIYDRQIRLWGMDAQNRIRNAHVLMAGIRAIGVETIKNLVLAGIGSVTLLDHTLVQSKDVGAQFFLQETHIGQNRAEAMAPGVRQLNKRVNVIVDTENVLNKNDAYFEDFDIVVMIHSDRSLLSRVDRLRRNIQKPFYAADAIGWVGYIFCDLITHTYIEERTMPATKDTVEPVVTRTTMTEDYVSFEQSLEMKWTNVPPKRLKKRISPLSFLINILFKFQAEFGRNPSPADRNALIKRKADYLAQMGVSDASLLDDVYLQDLCDLYDTELSPIAAIVGGILAQEIIKVLSQLELPIQNWFYYNGREGTGLIHQLS